MPSADLLLHFQVTDCDRHPLPVLCCQPTCARRQSALLHKAVQLYLQCVTMTRSSNC